MKDYSSPESNLMDFNLKNLEDQKTDDYVKEIAPTSDSYSKRGDYNYLNIVKNITNRKTKESESMENNYSFKNCALRGLYPKETDESYVTISKLPIVKRCAIEHCYFARSRLGSFKYHLRSLPVSESTVPFENESHIEQKPIEKETKSLLAKKLSSDNFEVNFKEGTSLVKRVNCSGSSSSSSSSDSEEPIASYINRLNKNRDGNSTNILSEDSKFEKKKSRNSLKHVRRKLRSRLEKPSINTLKNSATSDEKKLIWPRRMGISNYPTANKTPNNFVSVHDLLTKIRNMQNIEKVDGDKKFDEESEKIIYSQMRKSIILGNDENKSKSLEKSTIPLVMNGSGSSGSDKIDSTDEEVERQVIDDLLLQASKLNTQNFTKALENKISFDKKDNSKSSISVPNLKKNFDDTKLKAEMKKSTEFSLCSSFKSMLPEFHKSFDKPKENFLSSKKPGIKVKTVENINEEFKDSLGLKDKSFEDSSQNGVKEIIFSKKKKFSSIGGGSQLNEILEANEMKVTEEDSERLDKEDSNCLYVQITNLGKTEKQKPAILRSSGYQKKYNLLSSNNSKGNEADVEEQIAVEASKSEQKKAVDFVKQMTNKKAENNTLKEPVDPPNIKALESRLPTNPIEETEANPMNNSIKTIVYTSKKKSIPFFINRKKNSNNAENSPSEPRKEKKSKEPIKLVKKLSDTEKAGSSKTVLKMTSVEQKLVPKEAFRRFVKVVPYKSNPKEMKKTESGTVEEPQPKLSGEDVGLGSQKAVEGGPLISLQFFSNILKEILPEKWDLKLNPKYGLQIMKTYMDETLNPYILISVVIANTGKVVVNVLGRPLEPTHHFFSNLSSIGNSKNKLSLSYILGIISKFKQLSVCFGCEASLSEYWCEGGISECHIENHQIYRSQTCHLLVSLGKKRCYPCYRLNESLKKHCKRDKIKDKVTRQKSEKELSSNEDVNNADLKETTKGTKRSFEEFLEDSFSEMRKQVDSDIKKSKEMEKNEKELLAQEEALSLMGLARKESLYNSGSKTKKMANNFRSQQQIGKAINSKELEFLANYWNNINTLFSTSLLFGSYSRTSRGRLREKCRILHRILSTWREIGLSYPEFSGDVTLPDGDTVSNHLLIFTILFTLIYNIIYYNYHLLLQIMFFSFFFTLLNSINY